MRSTGDHDVDAETSVYQQRGALEIWRDHPYERTLTNWQRQPDGTYRQTVHRGGIVVPETVPKVSIDLNDLFGA